MSTDALRYLSSKPPLIIERRAGNRFDPLEDEPEWLTPTIRPLLALQVDIPEMLVGNSQGLALLRRAPDVTTVRAARWDEFRKEPAPVALAQGDQIPTGAQKRVSAVTALLIVLSMLVMGVNIFYLAHQSKIQSGLGNDDRDFRTSVKQKLDDASEFAKKQSDETKAQFNSLRLLLPKKTKPPVDDRSGARPNSDIGPDSRVAQ